jgi:23S rRNA (uracil1939-C5)-methyltransferase
MENPYRYRNKVQLPVGRIGGKIQIGFYAPRTHDIIDMEECIIQDEIGDRVIKIVRDWMEKYDIEPYDELSGRGIIRHIMIRKGFKTSEVMVVIVSTLHKVPHQDEIVEAFIKNIEGIRSVILNINKKDTNVILGDECITLWGENKISDYIGKFIFDISPLSFFQVNPYQTEVLYNKALEYAGLTGDETVFDAYCGTGTISLFLAQRAKMVYGVEIIDAAVKNAIDNADNNNVDNVEFITGESEKVIPELIEKGIHADIAVVDPPRKGCGIELLEALALMKPKRIVYVSCDPGTLARDLGILDSLGYRTLEIQPVDMFPQTAHVECEVKIERK